MLTLFYVNLALSLTLLVALFSLKSLKRFQWSLCGVLLPHTLMQFLFTARALGLKESMPMLNGLSFPLQIIILYFIGQFFKSLTPAYTNHKNIHRVYSFSFVFSLLWYVAAHTVFDIYDLVNPENPTLMMLIRTIALLIVAIFTLRNVLTSIKDFSTWAEKNISNVSRLRLPLLRGLIGYFLIAAVITLFDIATHKETQLFIMMPFLFTIGIFALIVYCLRASEVLTADWQAPIEEKISSEEVTKIQNKLMNIMANERAYLRPELRLTELAKLIDERPYKVTLVLSRTMGRTFNDYINSYRVEYAKNLLKDPKSDTLNLVGIAMESGFNSKSVFNDIFKKMTGMTPSAYKKSLNTTP
ncbi:MAG: helix-turn-helix transcriptional regulator [Bdellovibrionales bacterium]|nr:helix-turn-helix transcriptional regulator [Bdellovibrionales bacterium]